MSLDSNGRFLREAKRRLGRSAGGYESLKTILLRMKEDEKQAVSALVAFALRLAGTDRLPLRVPPPAPRAASVVAAPQPPTRPPSPPPAPKPRWTKDIRPGPHDLLTWEEAMQVPWFDPFKEPEG